MADAPAYAKFDDVKEGDRLRVDGGFSCMTEGAVKTVKRHADGHLFVDCAHGGHDLAGQLDDGDVLIGLTPVERAS